MKDYVLSVIGAAVICATAKSLLPDKSAAGRIAGLLCGVLMTVTVISPLREITFSGIHLYLNGLSSEANAYVEDGKAMAENQTAHIIKTQTEAYILDKATRMGLQIAVEVELDDKNKNIPCGASVSGKLSPYAREQLSFFMEDTLGIAKEKQIWK